VALTPEARRLTEEHRRAQAANQQGFLREFLAAWRLLDVRNLDSSTPSWLQVVMRLIELFRQDSARLSLDYARRYRRLELPDTDIELPEIDFFSGVGPRVLRELPRSVTRVPRAGRGRPRNRIPLRPVDGRLVINWRDRDPQVEASLRVTGPHTIKHRIGQGEPPERALRNAEAHAGGAGLRHVNDGGRDTALTVVQNDRAALGWIRLTAAGSVRILRNARQPGHYLGPIHKRIVRRLGHQVRWRSAGRRRDHGEGPRPVPLCGGAGVEPR
jgi:hypothetical protein